MRDVLRLRDPRLLLLSLAAYQAGDWLYGAALVVYMLQASGSAELVAAVGVVRMVPWVILAPPSGMLADRVSRKALLVVSPLAQAVVMLAMAAVALGDGAPAMTLALAALAAAAEVVTSPAVSAAFPLMGDERDLAAVNAWRSAILSFAMVVGPVFGAILLVLGSAAAAFVANGVLLLIAAVCVGAIRTPMGPLADDRVAAPETGFGWGLVRSTASDLATGVRALISSAATAVLVAVAAGILFAYTAQVVLWAVLADEHFGIGADALTVLYAAYGLGGLAATIPASRAAGGRALGRVLAGSIVVGGLSVVALARVTDLPTTAVLVAIQGVVVTMADVLGITLLQRALGAGVLGRAIGALDSTTSIAMVSGSAMAPLLLATGGLPGGFAAVGVALAVIGVVAAFVLRGAAALPADTAERLSHLAGLPLFAGAPQFALEGLAGASREVRLPPGAVVMREGDAPDNLYVIVSGGASVSTSASGEVNTMRPGDFFGEIGLLRGVPRTATVTTTEPTTLLRIDGQLFLELVGSGAAHGPTLGRHVGQRIARTRTTPAS